MNEAGLPVRLYCLPQTCHTMKKLVLFLLFAALPFAAEAQSQSFRFGYFSYQEALKAMPGYTIAQRHLDELKTKYDAETKRAEDEFNKKYEEFLDGQRDFAPSIRNKRQAELMDLMARNVAFKAEAKRLMDKATMDAYAPLKAQLTATVQQIGRDKGYAFVLNTDNDTAPYINPMLGDDISVAVREAVTR